MKLLYSLLRQNQNNRDGVVITTSVLGILVNLLLAGLKIIVGSAVSSIAIVSEGVNNASDSATSLITIVGTKLAQRRPSKKYPFGFGRIEYLTSLIIAVLILITGGELLISSVKLIFHPEALSVSVVTLVIIAVSALVKFFLGSYTIRMGKRVGSGSLTAVGVDCRNDCFVSIITIVSSLVFILFHFSVDAYAGIIMAAFVLKAGIDTLLDTVSRLLGQPADTELSDALYKEIRSTPEVLNAADMMLHNYGPDTYSGSVNIEVDHAKTIGEIYAIIHKLQLKIMHEHGVVMVFGMYAVDKDSEKSRKLREEIAEFIRGHEHILSYHALYITPDEEQIFCDLTVDYDLNDWGALKNEFTEYIGALHPSSTLELTIETDYV